MRPVLYSVAMSLDGFIAGPGGEVDWLTAEPDIDWAGFMGLFDTMLVGRRTWDFAVTHGSPSGFGDLRTLVFSRTLDAADHPGVEVVADDAAEVVAELRREEGKTIWLMGGGDLFRSLLDAGLVDGVEVAVVPVLLGRGIPLLAPWEGRARLTREHVQPYSRGIVVVRYAVAAVDPPVEPG